MSFGSYLVGTFEKRLGFFTQFQIVNPTSNLLNIHAIFLDAGGTVLHCIRAELNANALWETDTNILADKLTRDYGVAKFFSLDGRELKPGVVGFQRRVAAGPRPADVDYAAFGESNLAAVPEAFARDDYARVAPMCP